MGRTTKNIKDVTQAEGALPADLDPLLGAFTQQAVRAQTAAKFLAAVGRLLSQSELSVDRIFLSLQALHPAFRARTFLWRRETGRVTTKAWHHGLKNRPGYYDSPDFHVHRTGSELRIANLPDVEERHCDLYAKLGKRGFTDYLMVPLTFSDGTVNTLSVATKTRKGFSEEGLLRFRRATDLLAVIFERYAALETVASTLNTYLGPGVRREILQGNIRAGHGALVEATILFADLHDFTAFSAQLDSAGTVRLLNDYFDCLVGPIERHGGFVLKFIGDSLLAFFPREGQESVPCGPLMAVNEIRRQLESLNSARAESGRAPLRHGVCLHFGRVLYGNVGSSERLDFTIIGQDVNVAARGVEATKAIGFDYLFTGEFVAQFGVRSLVPAGTLTLRGIPRAVTFHRLAA